MNDNNEMSGSDWILVLITGAAANYMGPTFTYASLPPALQNAAVAAAAAASASQAATGLPLSHYAQSQLQEARMQWCCFVPLCFFRPSLLSLSPTPPPTPLYRRWLANEYSNEEPTRLIANPKQSETRCYIWW